MTPMTSGDRQRQILLFGVGMLLGVLSWTIIIFIINSVPSWVSSTNSGPTNQVEFASTDDTLDSEDSTETVASGAPLFLETTDSQSDFSREVEIYNHVATLDEPALVSLFLHNQTVRFASERRRIGFQLAILRRLATSVPDRALMLLDSCPTNQRSELVEGIFREWSTYDLNGAVAAVSTVEVSLRNTAIEVILRTRDDLSPRKREDIAKRMDSMKALATLTTEEFVLEHLDQPKETWTVLIGDDINDALQYESLIDLGESVVHQYGFDALSDLIGFDLGWRDRRLITQDVIYAFSDRNPEQTFRDAVQMPRRMDRPELPLHIMVSAARAWAETDPLNAINTILAHEQVPLSYKPTLISATIASWAAHNPEQLLDQIDIDSIPARFRMAGKVTAIGLLARTDIDRVNELIQDMDSIYWKQKAINTVANLLAEDAPEQALDWLRGQVAIEEIDYYTLASILGSLASRDPEAAMAKASDYADLKRPRPTTYSLETFILSYLAGSNPEVVVTLLPQVANDDRLNSYAQVARTFIDESKGNFILVVGEQLSPTEQQEYYDEIFAVWAIKNPKELSDLIDDLPTTKLKSSAVVQLVQNEWRGEVSKRRMSQLRRYLTKEDANWLEGKRFFGTD